MNHGSLGLLLLGIWLIITAGMSLTGIGFVYAGTLLNVLALVSGIFIVIGQRSRKWW